VGRDANINILEAIQMFTAAKKTSSAATILRCFLKAGIMQHDKCEMESESDVDMAKNWRHLYQKLDTEAEFDGFIRVIDDAVAPEVTE
jgi:hypothetical protein